MSNIEEQRILEELGRTQTVKDVRAAYNAIYEADRKLAVRVKHALQDKEKQEAEIAVFIDDLRTITGLEPTSRLFWRLFYLTLNARLRRHITMKEEERFNMGFPSGW